MLSLLLVNITRLSLTLREEVGKLFAYFPDDGRDMCCVEGISQGSMGLHLTVDGLRSALRKILCWTSGFSLNVSLEVQGGICLRWNIKLVNVASSTRCLLHDTSRSRIVN